MLFSALFRRNISTFDDEQLVVMVRKNDSKAMGELFKRYAGLVMGLCLKYLKNEANAEDMMMHVFEKLPEKISKGEIKTFKSWLYTVARNECLMVLRKKNQLTADLEKTLLYTTDKSEENLEIAHLKEHQLNQLEEALAQLKDEQKRSLELFYLKEKSYDEVASTMGVTVKKVKSLIQNGKRNLKLKLEKEHGF